MIAIIIFISVVVAWITKIWTKRRSLPPGPIPLPLIGNIHQIVFAAFGRKNLVDVLHKFKDEYGDIFTLWLGPMPLVNLCRLDLAQEAMVKKGAHFAYKSLPELFVLGRKGLGIIATNGRLWSEQRRFALHTFRDFGFGKNPMEQRILEEFNLRSKQLESEMVDGIWIGNPSSFIEPMVGSVINRILFGVGFDEKNEREFFALKAEIDRSIEESSLIDLMAKKWMLDVPLLKSHFAKKFGPTNRMLDFINKRVMERVHSIENGDHVIASDPDDYVDAFLRKMESEKDLTDTTFTLDSLCVNLMDLWAAGQETTSTTIQWGLLHLANRPDIASEVHKELREVLGYEDRLSQIYKQRTPKLNAVITEIQRLASILNISSFEICDDNVQIDHHIIPKGTTVSAQISVIMSSSKFENPETFDPWRYLGNPELEQHVVPFALGKRACLGESLARAELYLILGNLLLNYEITAHGEMPDLTPLEPFGVMKRPKKAVLKISKIPKP